jgi:hypothetical protein
MFFLHLDRGAKFFTSFFRPTFLNIQRYPEPLTERQMQRPKQYPKESHKFSKLTKDTVLEQDSGLPRSRHIAASLAAILLAIILIYLKLFNHS